MPIPLKTREKMNNDPLYTTCALYGQHGHVCEGRITREHAIIIAGKKCQKEWAIIPCCARGHGVDQFQDAGGQIPKDMREWCALNRATDKDIQEAVGEGAYSDINPLSRAAQYVQRRKGLNAKYGIYERKMPLLNTGFGINPAPDTKPLIFIEKPQWYPVSSFDKKIIDHAKAQLRMVDGFRCNDNTMIAIMIREYGKTLDIIDTVVGEEKPKINY